MTRGVREDERIAQLRAQIAADLTLLRRRWGVRAQWTHRTADGWLAGAARLRRVPTWAVGALAGFLAAVWSALRRPRKVQ